MASYVHELYLCVYEEDKTFFVADVDGRTGEYWTSTSWKDGLRLVLGSITDRAEYMAEQMQAGLTYFRRIKECVRPENRDELSTRLRQRRVR